MPIYEFENPKTGETIEVIQGMKDKHTFIDDQGVEWHRKWAAPNAAMDSQIDPDSPKQFVNKTKNWSVGQMWDYSKELSQERESKRGHDHIGEAHHSKRENEIQDIRKKNRRKARDNKKP